MTMIAAQPGWHVVFWSTQHGSAVKLPVVAWEGVGAGTLLPYYLDEDQVSVDRLKDRDESLLFIAIMPPGDDLSDYMEAAENTAKAYEDANWRRERQHEQERLSR